MPISLPQDLSFMSDVILILISGLACLYCYLLNRRLTKLSNLKSGLGATIITLTKAIEETHKAAQSAQTSTQEAVKELNELLKKSEKITPEVELLVSALQRTFYRAQDQQELLEYSIEISLGRAVNKAEKKASELLSVVSQADKIISPPVKHPYSNISGSNNNSAKIKAVS